jgi:hypothetical protein
MTHNQPKGRQGNFNEASELPVPHVCVDPVGVARGSESARHLLMLELLGRLRRLITWPLLPRKGAVRTAGEQGWHRDKGPVLERPYSHRLLRVSSTGQWRLAIRCHAQHWQDWPNEPLAMSEFELALHPLAR